MRFNARIAAIFFTAILISTSACTPAQPQTGDVLKSDKQRLTSVQVSQPDLEALVAGNNAFALKLYRLLGEDDTNLFYSPFSISMALAMTYAGARDDTASQMADTLHFTMSQDRLHPAFNSLDTELSQRGEGAKGKDDKGFRLNIVNAIWGQKGYTFLPAFLDTLAENYGAGLRVLDFVGAAEASRITINDWVSDQTEGRIKDLIPPGAIDSLTRLVLTNAIYFNAAWQYPFQEEGTKDGIFHLLNDREVTAPMMHVTESFGYAEGNSYQAVALPYDGRELSMLILLPEPGQFSAFEQSLTSEQIDAIIKGLKPRQIALTMPRFEFTSGFSVKKALATMGMPIAFSGNADFSGMTGKPDLFISDVIHKAFVSVDESGTEAAAATAVIMRLTAMPESPMELTIDHPFIFLIRDNATGTMLFIGRVMDPSA
jgi:serpin B